MKILITGNRGFVGSETEKLFKEKGLEVIGYDIMDGLDIRNLESLESIIFRYRPDRILHLAAIARFDAADKDPKLNYEINALGTKNVVDVAKKFNLPLVYASSISVYMPIQKEGLITEEWEASGNALYSCSKYTGEKYVQEHTPHIILRYAHLYGIEKKYHGLIGGFVSRIQRGLSPVLYGGSQSNNFTYVKDIAEANYLAITTYWDNWNQIYNIGTNEDLAVGKATEILCDYLKYNGEIAFESAREKDPKKFIFDVSKAEKMLGFKAKYNFEEGIKNMIQDGFSLKEDLKTI